MVGEVGHPVVARHLDEFDLRVQRLADQVGDVDVITFRLHVRANGAERRVVFKHADPHDAGLGDRIQRVGMGGRSHECR